MQVAETIKMNNEENNQKIVMLTDDGEVHAIHKVTQLVWCKHNGHALCHCNGVLALWDGKHLVHVVNEVWFAL